MRPDLAARLWAENPDAFVAIAPDGGVLFWNPAAEAIFGIAEQDALGRSLFDLIVPADRAEEERARQAEALREGLSVYEAVRRRGDGTLVHVNVSTKAVRDADGSLAYFLSGKKEVTHLKVLRDAKLLQTRYGQLLGAVPDAIVMVNATGRIVLVNAQAERMFGYASEALTGKPVEILLPQRFRDAHFRHRGGFFELPRTRTMGAGLDLYALRSGGAEFPVEISLSPLETEEGLFVSSAIRDVTERKRFEQALREKNLELENAAQVKDRFLASMSHELRTPLNAIIGFTGTILMKLPGPLNAEQEKQMRIVQGGARHLLSLINDLLDLARLGANKLELRLERVDCAAVLDEVGATLRPEAERKGLAFRLSLPDEVVTISTDRRALSQILLNLTGNAIKFTDRGHVELALESRAGARRGWLAFRVEDSGPGIAPEDQATLFEAFSRGNAAERRRREGTGLGLHLSRRLAEELGGSLGFESEVGRGSAFTLVLPEA